MGVKNARSLGRIQKFTQAGDIDVILHVGDMAYDMHEVTVIFNCNIMLRFLK